MPDFEVAWNGAQTVAAEKASQRPAPDLQPEVSLRALIRNTKRDRLLEALEECRWVQQDAADKLSISPRMLSYHIRALGLQRPARYPILQGRPRGRRA